MVGAASFGLLAGCSAKYVLPAGAPSAAVAARADPAAYADLISIVVEPIALLLPRRSNGVDVAIAPSPCREEQEFENQGLLDFSLLGRSAETDVQAGQCVRLTYRFVDAGSSSCAPAIRFTPRAGSRYELLFTRDPLRCRVRLIDLEDGGEVARADAPLWGIYSG